MFYYTSNFFTVQHILADVDISTWSPIQRKRVELKMHTIVARYVEDLIQETYSKIGGFFKQIFEVLY